MEIIRLRKIFYTLSILIVGASIFSLLFFGLKLGIDFTGGSLLEVNFQESRPSGEQIKNALVDLDLGEINIQPVEEKGVILRLKNINEETHQIIINKLNLLADGAVAEKRFESIGPVIGQEMKKKAIWSILLVLIMIILYIAWAFRQVSKPISSFVYGAAAIVALFHDTLIVPGVFAVLGYYQGVEINLLFITGLLTVLGFSVHDTIVVFDRIRENLRRGLFDNFEMTVNESIKQTITRSINTSLTVLLTVLAIYIFGGATIKHFALLLIIGIFFGTYSSIFLASPLLVSWHKYKMKK